MDHEYIPLHELTQEEKTEREAFVNEYIKDFNATQAALRIGYSFESARSASTKFLHADSYVSGLLNEKIKQLDESDIVTRKEILFNIKKIAYSSLSEDTRLKAWSKLAKLMGMEINYIKAELVGSNNGPLITSDMSQEEAARIYASEVLGK